MRAEVNFIDSSIVETQLRVNKGFMIQKGLWRSDMDDKMKKIDSIDKQPVI